MSHLAKTHQPVPIWHSNVLSLVLSVGSNCHNFVLAYMKACKIDVMETRGVYDSACNVTVGAEGNCIFPF